MQRYHVSFQCNNLYITKNHVSELILTLIDFRIEMDVYSDHIENFEILDQKVESDERKKNLELEVKIE